MQIPKRCQCACVTSVKNVTSDLCETVLPSPKMGSGHEKVESVPADLKMDTKSGQTILLINQECMVLYQTNEKMSFSSSHSFDSLPEEFSSSTYILTLNLSSI